MSDCLRWLLTPPSLHTITCVSGVRHAVTITCGSAKCHPVSMRRYIRPGKHQLQTWLQSFVGTSVCYQLLHSFQENRLGLWHSSKCRWIDGGKTKKQGIKALLNCKKKKIITLSHSTCIWNVGVGLLAAMRMHVRARTLMGGWGERAAARASCFSDALQLSKSYFMLLLSPNLPPGRGEGGGEGGRNTQLFLARVHVQKICTCHFLNCYSHYHPDLVRAVLSTFPRMCIGFVPP
jgi:hypothetical protein